MALSQDQIRTQYPLPVYNYKVDIGTDTIAFSEVSGLELSFETITYKESPTGSGVVGPNIMHMPGSRKPLNITMKKGFVKGKSMPTLYNWLNATQLNQTIKKDITVHLCDEKGESVVRWKVIDAFPVKLSAPSFNAGSNEIAIESIELMASSLEMAGG